MKSENQTVSWWNTFGVIQFLALAPSNIDVMVNIPYTRDGNDEIQSQLERALYVLLKVFVVKLAQPHNERETTLGQPVLIPLFL